MKNKMIIINDCKECTNCGELRRDIGNWYYRMCNHTEFSQPILMIRQNEFENRKYIPAYCRLEDAEGSEIGKLRKKI